MSWRLIPAYLLFGLGSAVMLVPFLWMISTSLKENAEVFVYPPVWFPSRPL